MDLEDTMILHGSSEAEHQNFIPPGTYKVEIELHVICVQSPTPMKSDVQLSLSYPPFGIPADSGVFCTVDKESFRKPPNCDRPRMVAGIYNGPLELIAQLGPENVEALKEPIMIESNHGVAEINFIDVFSAPILNNKRELRNGADLISKLDGATIGHLIYSIQVQETSTIGESSSAEESEIGPTPRSSQTPIAPPPPIPLPTSAQQGIDSMDGQAGSKDVRNVETIEDKAELAKEMAYKKKKIDEYNQRAGSPQEGIDSEDEQDGSNGIQNEETIEYNWQTIELIRLMYEQLEYREKQERELALLYEKIDEYNQLAGSPQEEIDSTDEEAGSKDVGM